MSDRRSSFFVVENDFGVLRGPLALKDPGLTESEEWRGWLFCQEHNVALCIVSPFPQFPRPSIPLIGQRSGDSGFLDFGS